MTLWLSFLPEGFVLGCLLSGALGSGFAYLGFAARATAGIRGCAGREMGEE
jgi:hypothetical protein